MPVESGSMSYWSSLQRSLTDRADALMEYTDSLLVDSDRSDDGFTRALKMCRLYTRVFIDSLKHDIGVATSEIERREVAEGHLQDFMERYARIDRWLSRGSQSAVPRALQTICRRQFDAAGLTSFEPVLTVGAPDSFEAARTTDLHKYLFHGPKRYDEKTAEEVDELRGDKALAIISVPYIEGTRTLWYPITVGHEICHLRMAETTAGIKLADLASRWIASSSTHYDAAVEQLKSESSEFGAEKLIRGALLNNFRLWTVEMACDLNAVRLFGPAGARAIAEFVSLADSTPSEASFESTHPPSALRLEIMLRYLERLGFPMEELKRQVSAWPEPPGSGEHHDAVTRLLISALDRATDDLCEMLSSWGFQLESSDEFEQMVQGCVDNLLDGAPCGTHLRCNEGDSWSSTTTAHVVNAAWHARETLATDSGEHTADGQALLARNMLPKGEQRLHLDRLAAKAIDSIELARLWRDTSKIVSPDRIKSGDRLDNGDTVAGGILSSFQIVERLKLDNLAESKRLLVTPLFSDAVTEAGVDLRLGPDFIVFRHSATAAFDPLSRAHDPRMVQKRVTKSWGERFVLHPNELVLAATLEYLVIPSDLSAQVITRSSYGRLGLMTATAVQIQPGSRGCITLELKNQGETPIVLTPGARVAQLILWSVIDPAKARPAKYWFPTGPEFSKAHDDPEGVELSKLGARVHERQPDATLPLEVRFAGSFSDCEYFAETAEKVHGTSNLQRPRAEEDPAGCEFCATTTILARVLQRWGAAQAQGMQVVHEPGKWELELHSEPSIDRAMIELRGEGAASADGLLLDGRDPGFIRTALDELMIDPAFAHLATMPV